MSDEFMCPKCGNDNQMMFDFSDHRREQVTVNCQVCAHGFVHIFKNVPKENIIPSEVMKNARQSRAV